MALSVNGCTRTLCPAFRPIRAVDCAESFRTMRPIEQDGTTGKSAYEMFSAPDCSAVTFRVLNMTDSVRFYRDVLGIELLYGGEGTVFSSLRAKDTQSAILNLEQGKPMAHWGRLIFYVTDVDALWNHLKDRGFDPEIPRDASWGGHYFHLPDPDGHELSFARPL
jgi:catechol 2,3-dioxygenase-like lactoylglutathione lyase family enzyme